MIKLLSLFILLFGFEKILCEDPIITQGEDPIITQDEDPIITQGLVTIYKRYETKIEFYIEDEDYILEKVECYKSASSVSERVNPLDLRTYIEDDDNNIKECKDLKPCTTYDVTATVYNNTGNKTFDERLSVETKFAEPKIKNVKVNVEQLGAIMEWESENSSCIAEFQLAAKADGDSKVINDNNSEKKNHKFLDLQPCLIYTFTLNTKYKNQKLVHNYEKKIETMIKEPGDVRKVQYSNYTLGKVVQITWEKPPFWTCAKFYYLQWHCDHIDCEVENYTITNPTINQAFINVDTCSEYTLTIGTNKIESDVKVKFYSAYLEPSPIANLNLTNPSYKNPMVTWNIESNYRCIAYYNLTIIGPLQEEEIIIQREARIEKANYTIPEELEPCGNYSISIKVVTITNQIIEFTKQVFVIAEERPGQIIDARVKYVYPTEILLAFRNSSLAHLCVEQFRINCWPSNNRPVKTEHYNKTLTSFIIKNLNPCTKYEVQIIALTYQKKESDPFPLSLITTVSKPTTDVVIDNNAKINYNSLELSGGSSDKDNECEIFFAKFECKAKSDAPISYAERIVKRDIGTKFKALIHPLSPHTEYECQLKIYNVAGWSAIVGGTAIGNWNTSSYFPDIPESIQTKVLSDTSFNVKWSPPKYMNGILIIYKIHIQSLGLAYKQPDYCIISDDNSQGQSSIVNNDKTEFNFTSAKPYNIYSAQIGVTNDFGTGQFSEPTYIKTKPSASQPIEEILIQIQGPDIEHDKYEANVTITWRAPCITNGIIKSYILIIDDDRPDSKKKRIEIENNESIVNETGYINYTEKFYYPELNYTVTIKVLIDDVDEESEGKIIEFIAPSGIPEKIPEPEKNEYGTVDVFLAKNPTNSALVKLSKKFFQSNMGQIIYAAILISERDCQEDPQMKAEIYDISIKGWPNWLKGYNDVQNGTCIEQYQTTPKNWKPFRSIMSKTTAAVDPDDSEVIEYIIGNGGVCDDFEAKYCNGKLKENTKYKLILRTFTKNGYRDSVDYAFVTDKPIEFLLIISLIVCVLLIAFFIGFVYLWVIKRKMWNRQSLNGEDLAGNVSTKNFLLRYTQLSAKDKVQKEFKDLAVVGQDVSIASTISKYNESKNRYSNIYPYEKNRVILNSDSEGSDYINASFINGYKHRKEYIATQGPKPESFIDFWKMVLEYNVKVIVMVTQFVEGNMIKCHVYFPMINGKEMKFGNNITILCKSQTANEIYERRELIVKHGVDEIQTVIHYLFKKWPDHDVPSDPNELITFVKRVKSERTASHIPIIVHCSAGVGRTGTFIALDLIMQKIKNENKINVYETVKSLRFQRMKMVQSIPQYQFLYRCALELVKKKYEKFAKSKTAKLFLTRSNSELLEQINGFTNSKSSNDVSIDGIKTNLSNGRLNTNHSDTKLKNNNYSNNSIISNNSITRSGPSSSSTGGFSKSSKNSFNPNDRESVM